MVKMAQYGTKHGHAAGKVAVDADQCRGGGGWGV